MVQTFFQLAEQYITFTEEIAEKRSKGKGKKKARKQKKSKVSIKTHCLHHAAGLVFCHHKAPIHRMVKLAEDLAGLAKEASKESLLAYQMLESFDHAGTNLEAWRKERTAPLCETKGLFIRPGNLGAIQAHI